MWLLKSDGALRGPTMSDLLVGTHRIEEPQFVRAATHGSQQGLGPKHESLNENCAYEANRGTAFEN